MNLFKTLGTIMLVLIIAVLFTKVTQGYFQDRTVRIEQELAKKDICIQVIPYNMTYAGRSNLQKTFWGNVQYFCNYKNATSVCKREIIDAGDTETTINLECSERAGEIELNKI